jgi:hypothetical protein
LEFGLSPKETERSEKGERGKMKKTVGLTDLTEAEIAETMRRQILSWPSKVNVDGLE